jgi:hypothetical protein
VKFKWSIWQQELIDPFEGSCEQDRTTAAFKPKFCQNFKRILKNKLVGDMRSKID